MRRYSQEEEERIRAQRLVREWTQSGLLEEPQGVRLAEELRVELRRTNPFLRAGLALFTGLIVAASVTLLITFLNLRGDVPIAATTGLAALACIGLAEYLVHEFRCYRFGVEEALAVAAVGLLSIAGGELTSSFHLEPRGMPATVALLIAGAGGFGLDRRFGFVYAACGGIFCVAAIPFQLDLSAATQRILAAATIASVLLVARSKRLKYRDDYPGDEYGLMQAAALAGVYVVLNVQLTDWYRVDQPFYGFTYALTWALPLAGLALAIREKDRLLMDVSLVLALVSVLTNKAYLGSPQHAWDPCLLGVLLIAIAFAIRRWLSNGPGGERHGFTAARLLERDRAVLSAVGTASGFVRPGVSEGAALSRVEPAPSDFDGGRSGGGGASGSF
jgi:uncharacterized membrane protein YgcG